MLKFKVVFLAALLIVIAVYLAWFICFLEGIH